MRLKVGEKLPPPKEKTFEQEARTGRGEQSKNLCYGFLWLWRFGTGEVFKKKWCPRQDLNLYDVTH